MLYKRGSLDSKVDIVHKKPCFDLIPMRSLILIDKLKYLIVCLTIGYIISTTNEEAILTY